MSKVQVFRGFHPIETARFVEVGTVADLRMLSGRIVRAKWCAGDVSKFTCCVKTAVAWWPLSGKGRCIPLYTPEAWRPIGGKMPRQATAEEKARDAEIHAELGISRDALQGGARDVFA